MRRAGLEKTIAEIAEAGDQDANHRTKLITQECTQMVCDRVMQQQCRVEGTAVDDQHLLPTNTHTHVEKKNANVDIVFITPCTRDVRLEGEMRCSISNLPPSGSWSGLLVELLDLFTTYCL